MIFRFLLLATLLLVHTDARAEPAVERSGFSPKLMIYLAKGPPNSCGPGCNRWIAIEGTVDVDAASRVEQFFRDVKDTQRPVYFHSPGGEVRPALAIGRLLRSRKMIGRVGRTVADACPGTQADDACVMIKTDRDEVEATIATRNAACHSSCTYMLFGTINREVAPDAVLGVHNSKIVMEFRINTNESKREELMARSRAQSEHDLTAYLEAMGINHELLDLVETIDFEHPRALTRQEIYRFRIDTRDFAETVWTLDKGPRPHISKFAMVKNGDGFRKLELQLYCESKVRARLMLTDELDKAATGTRTVSIIAGLEKPPNLVKFPVRVGSSEIWNAVIAPDAIKSLFNVRGLKFGESTPVPDGKATETTFEIETASLENPWNQLFATCATLPSSTTPPRTAALPGTARGIIAVPVPGMPSSWQTLPMRQAQTHANEIQIPRAFAAAAQINKFTLWAKSKGLRLLPKAPVVKANVTQAPTVDRDSITLGPANADYLIPGMYVNAVAASQGFETDPKNATHELMWTAADYMASRFGDIAFPNPAGPRDSPSGRSAEVARLFHDAYDLFNELIGGFGNDTVEAGVINMMNEWNAKSDLQSSLASFAAGMTRAGADAKSVQAAFEKFKAEIVLKVDAQGSAVR